MKMRSKVIFLVTFTISINLSFGQFKFKRKLSGVKEKYHSIILPDDIFEKTKADCSDIRISGINTKGDTSEVPYLFSNELHISETQKFNILNSTKIGDQFFFTLENKTDQDASIINLKFQNANYDWKVKLEGSNDNFRWFGILDNYRILGFKNQLENYSFNELAFEKCKYKYFRISIKSDLKPILIESTFDNKKVLKEELNEVEIISTKKTDNQKNKSTIFEIELKNKALINHLKFEFEKPSEFLRKIEILSFESIQNQSKVSNEYYELVFQGQLNSTNNGNLDFGKILTRKIKIIIYNDDNQAIPISNIGIKGPITKVIARFDKKENDYYLIYGNQNIQKPKYDLINFISNIPDTLNSVLIEKEEAIKAPKNEAVSKFPKLILWITMGLLIFVIGWFSLKMLKQN